ncbi:MAG: hypothetical protein AAF959_02885 [Cyanobacteria bacterium P01_D01_bin.56]
MWTGDTGNFCVLRPTTVLTGGFNGGSTLEIQHDPASINEEVNLNITFANGQTGLPAPVERARLIVLDIDRDNSNTWQDLVQLGGSVTPSVTAATQNSNALGVSPEIAASIAGIPLGVDQANGGTAPGLTPLANYTVNLDTIFNEFIGVYNPRGNSIPGIDGRLDDPVTTTEFTPINTSSNDGGVDVNPSDPLPDPGLGGAPAAGVEANNQSSEGTVTADYISSAGNPVTNLSLTYGNGPASPGIGINGPGTAGYVDNPNDTNGGPLNHGIGLYTVFIVPGVIGTAKNASTPVQVPNTATFEVTYTVTVENLGTATPLTDVQATDDLTQTFEGTTGFTVSSAPTIVSGNLTPNPNFDGNGDQNLFADGGTLAPGESAVIAYTVTLDTGPTFPNIVAGRAEPYNNTVLASGTTPVGLRITDTSDDDSTIDQNNPPDPDPNDNGDPGDPGEDTPTPVTLPPIALNPNINVAEEAFNVELNPTTGPAPTFPDNTARVSYRIRVQNTGDERLTNVTLTNDFTPTFDDGTRGVPGDVSGPDTGFSIVSVTRSDGNETEGAFEPNGAYNGGDGFDADENPIADVDTLAENGILNPGDFTEYVILVDVDTTGNGQTLTAELPGPFNNFTRASGLGTALNNPSGVTVRDVSNDIAGFGSLEAALNPADDPAGGGSPTGGSVIDPPPPNPELPAPDTPENIPTPVNIPLVATDPRINVSEQVVNSVLFPTGTFGNNTGQVTYRIRVQNTGDEDLENVLLINDFSRTFDDGTRGGSGPDNGFQIVAVRQRPGNGANANPFNDQYDGGDTDNGVGQPFNDDATLLTGGSLVVCEFSEYEIDVDVDLTGTGSTLTAELPGPYNNFTGTQGDGVTSGITVRDYSNDIGGFNTLEDALNPDGGSPTGGSEVGPLPPAVSPLDAIAPPPSNAPADENVLTPVELPLQQPLINVAEQVFDIELNPTAGPAPIFPGNTARVSYRIRVQNTGNERLNNVTLTNDFTPTFDDGTRGLPGAISGPDTGFEIVSVIRSDGNETEGAFEPNADYNGGDGSDSGGVGSVDDTDLLAENGILNPGEFTEYEIIVDVDTTGNGQTLTAALPGPFDNFTVATGVGADPNTPSGLTVRDVSNDIGGFNSLEDALNPPDGSTTGGATTDPEPPSAPSTDPTLENVPSQASIILTPKISVIERIDDSRTQIGDIPPAGATPGATFGSSNVRLVYQIVVRNIGVEDLQNVELTNSFVDTYGVLGTGATDDYTIVTPPTLLDGTGGVTTVPVNPAFDGSGDLRLAFDPIDPTSSILNTDEFAVYEILVDVNTAGANVAPNLPGPFDNQTIATGIGVGSQETTTDLSNDINPFPNGGTTPDPETSDPNGNSEANEDGENDPTPALLGSDLSFVKRITQVIRNGQPVNIPGINDFNDQAGTEDDNDLSNATGQNLPLGVFDIQQTLQTGDEVEYTVYFFNQGVVQAANVEMCDELQVPTVLQPATLELAQPVTFAASNSLSFGPDNTLLFPQAPLAPLPESCVSFPGSFPSGTPAGGLGVGAGGGVVVGGPNLGLDVDSGTVGAFRFRVQVP